MSTDVGENFKSYTIGVDIGTGSARACIVDQDGNLAAIASKETHTWQSRPKCYEQSTSNIWRSICKSVKTILGESGIDPSLVTAIVFSATCSLAVFDADSYEPVSVATSVDDGDEHNVVLWMHSAATKEAELISKTAYPAINHLGGSISPFMTIAKVLWLKNNMTAGLFQRSLFFDLQDAISFIATGQSHRPCSSTCADFHNSGHGIDGAIKGWDPGLLRSIGLEYLNENGFKQIGGVCKHGHPPEIGSPVGRLCHQAAMDLGLSSEVIVGTGVIDCYAGWIGTVGTSDCLTKNGSRDVPPTNRIAIVAGTSACHVVASDRSHFVKGLWGPYADFLLPATYTVAGGQPAVGRLLQHVMETHPAYEEALSQAEFKHQSIFDFLNNHLHTMKSSQDAPNLVYLGRHVFFYGDHFGNRTPIGDANMTGSIIGLTGDTDINNLVIMYYSAMEFLALQTRHIIDTMVDNGSGNGHHVSGIYMSGSVCQNPVFTKLLATACNLPVVIPCYSQGAVCYGSAVLAAHTRAMASENGSSGLWSFMTSMSKPGTVILPDTDQYARNLLEVKYTVLLEQAERQRVFRNMIDAVPRM